MAITVGNIVSVVTSGEQGFVLNLGTEAHTSLSGITADLRLASIGRDGVKYVIQTFFVEELETEEERIKRELERFRSMQPPPQALTSAPASPEDALN